MTDRAFRSIREWIIADQPWRETCYRPLPMKHHTTKLDLSIKKLALRKELIRELQIKELDQVAGGFKTTEKSTGCC